MIYENLSKTSSNDPLVLVLGGGYIGNSIADYIISSGKGFDVKIVKSSLINYHDKKMMWRLLVNYDPALIINCSGFTDVDGAESKQEECWEYNVKNPLMVANLCAQYGVKHIHISSGCIYNGYHKIFTEEDDPNFGLWNNSNTYSKTKHAFEFLSKEYPSKILRISYPVSKFGDRSLLSKLKSYDNLTNTKTSKTYVPDLCEFVLRLITDKSMNWKSQDIYNVVNSSPLSTKQICELMFYGRDQNPKWDFVTDDKVVYTTPRSNAILDNTKANTILPMRTDFEMMLDIYKEHLNGLQLTPEVLI
jgi:dTDP-4-dehydrorhamnose reductase